VCSDVSRAASEGFKWCAHQTLVVSDDLPSDASDTPLRVSTTLSVPSDVRVEHPVRST